LPAPSATIPVSELVDFKNDHGGALQAFRDHLDGALIDVAAIEDPDAREERRRIVRSELVRERDRLAAEMRSRRWPPIVFGAVGGVAAAAAAVTAPFFVGGGVAAAAVTAPGLVAGVYGAIETIRRIEDFADRPVAYAALTERAFAPGE
jgi:hypothetical protein